MVDAAIASYPTEVFNALTGVDKETFYYVFHKYCGPGTPIRK